MKTRYEHLKESLFPNLDYLMKRCFLSLIKPDINFNLLLELIDKELKIANCALKDKKKPDYKFETIRVSFKRVRRGEITISIIKGCSIIIDKEMAPVFDEWVNISPSLKMLDWREYVVLGNAELGRGTYRLYDSNDSMKGSISEEMRKRHKNNHSIDILNGTADQFLRSK